MKNMSMRSQVYEWANLAPGGAGSTLSRSNTDQVVPVPANVSTDIFIGGIGNNITKPAETTATQFIVIEDISTTPWLAGAVQVRINTTDYFLNPDNVTNAGIPGTASPYPRSLDFQPSFNLYPDVYVLPGQVWDVRVTSFARDSAAAASVGAGGATIAVAYAGDWGKAPAGTAGIVAGDALMNGIDFNAFVKYTLYDGPDALIANKLLEMGISINPGNVDWYKRSLLSAQGM